MCNCVSILSEMLSVLDKCDKPIDCRVFQFSACLNNLSYQINVLIGGSKVVY